MLLSTLLFAAQLLLPNCLANITLNIGVIPPWRKYVTEVVTHMDASFTFKITDADLSNVTNQYDKIEHARSYLERLGVHVLVGPYSLSLSLGAQALALPYLATTRVEREGLATLQVIPPHSEVCQAVLDLVLAYKWDSIFVIYDDDRGRPLLELLMTVPAATIRAWRLPEHAQLDHARDALVHMRKSLVERAVLFTSSNNTDILVDEARNLAMLSTPPYQWILYDPADEMWEIFENYGDIAINFTVLTLLPPYTNGSREDRLSLSLARDALQVVTSAAKDVVSSAPDVISDDADFTTKLGRAIRRQKQEEGMTGNLTFGENGKRSNFSVYMQVATGQSILQRGVWRSQADLFDTRLQLFSHWRDPNFTTPFPLRGRVANVVMIREKPFTMYKRDYENRKGNDRFEGFAVDLLKEVATRLQFDYKIHLVRDGKFGSKLPSGEWNGIIGELLSGDATLSVAPLSINSQREEAVDFTKPFMTRYISVLMKVPRRETSYFEFLNPLSPIVWICTMCAFVIVSIVLYILERIGVDKRREEDHITIKESFWFIFGSLLQGNTDSSPTTIPGRILTSSWWFFALILISSYTANLAAFLTVKKINTPIKSVSDLAQQTKIKYGTVKSSGVMNFFKNSNIDHFSKMWAFMSEIEPGAMVNNTEAGYIKVKEGDYAFFWDTTVNKYKTIVDCEMMEIGPPFDPKGFGIGVPPGATYSEDLSLEILRLSDSGLLHQLETKWWGSRNCPDLTKPTADETSELQIDNVAGVFFILVGGILCAALVRIIEFFSRAVIKPSASNKNHTVTHVSKEKESFI